MTRHSYSWWAIVFGAALAGAGRGQEPAGAGVAAPPPAAAGENTLWIGPPEGEHSKLVQLPGALAEPRLGWCVAYLWHRAGKDWEPGGLHAELEKYDSNDPETQRWNIQLWKECGMDFAAGCWFGVPQRRGAVLPTRTTEAFESYLRTCEQEKFRWCAWMADIPGGLEPNLEQVRKWAKSPAYFRWGKPERPVLFIYERTLDKLGRRENARAALDKLRPYKDEFFLVLVGVPAAGIPKQERGLGLSWYGLPWMEPKYLAEQYRIVAERPDLDLFALLFHSFDNRATRAGQNAGTLWPEGGPSLPFAVGQLELAVTSLPNALGVPWDELGERSAWCPTRELGRQYYDLLKATLQNFKAAGSK
ncbi:MAG: hypothetical protein EYC70_06200 [Planctomycetota bacterium]|nr:MAG: hypothetical protein EYC70_06200 [Planctomycetota bacterium]